MGCTIFWVLFGNAFAYYVMKSGAPPDKVGSPAPSVAYRIPWFQMQN